MFRTCALRAVDAALGVDLGASLESAVRRGGYAALVGRLGSVRTVPGDLRDVLFELPSLKLDREGLTLCLNVPERVAEASGRPLVVGWDEFQELALAAGRLGVDPLSIMRAAWQRHRHVAYVISGSEPSLLRELCTSRRSPFFQHFELMELGPMSEADGVALLLGASEGALGDAVARRLVSLVGAHPFYLQVLGDELLRGGAPYDDAALKECVQRTLFSRTGRLGLYFERRFGELAGQSTFAAAVLRALATAREGLRLTDLARAIGAPSGDTARYIERLGDACVRGEDARWRLVDPAFALWLAWREPLGCVVPMSVLGDEGEHVVATALADRGFDLVYQSRASRGAFDLLATRGASQLGVQVKRMQLPLRFTLPEWRRMEAESARLGWVWVIAAVADGATVFLDPALARVGRTVRLHPDATIPNLLAWVDQRG